MANTVAVSGSLALAIAIQAAFGGDTSGGRSARVDVSKILDATGIAVDGFVKGSPVCAAGDWVLGHASDPFGAMGDAAYSDGLAPAGKKIKLLCVVNKDAVQSITVSRKTTNGLPLFSAVDDAVTIQPGGVLLLVWPTGLPALNTGTNDAVTIAVSGGTRSLKCWCAMGRKVAAAAEALPPEAPEISAAAPEVEEPAPKSEAFLEVQAIEAEEMAHYRETGERREFYHPGYSTNGARSGGAVAAGVAERRRGGGSAGEGGCRGAEAG